MGGRHLRHRKARVCVHPGDGNKNWLTGVCVVNIHNFVEAVQSEIGEQERGNTDKYIGLKTAADILRIPDTSVMWLARDPADDKTTFLRRTADHVIPRRGFSPQRPYQRSDIEAFARRFMFAREI